MTGRPTIYNDELAAKICKEIALGRSLRSVCKDDGIPDMSTVLLWAFTPGHPFSKQYEDAREIQAESLADEMQEIADDGTNDWMERQNKDGSSQTVVNTEHIQRSRLRVDTRKWIASKLKPKRYGDKQHVEHSGKLTLESLLDDSMKDEKN